VGADGARIVLPLALIGAPPDSVYWTVSWEPNGRYAAQSPGAAGLGISVAARDAPSRPLDERLRQARRLYWETGSAASLPVVYEQPEAALTVALRDSVIVLQLGPSTALSQLRQWRPDTLRLDVHRWTFHGTAAAWIPVSYVP
jgi:hypothetical protein